MKLDYGRAWNDAVAMLKANRDVVLVVAGMFFFLPTLIIALAIPPELSQLQLDENVAPGEAFDAIAKQVRTLFDEFWWLIVPLNLVQATGGLGLLALLRDPARPTLGEALKLGATGLLPSIAAQVLIGMMAVLVVAIPVGLAAAIGLPLLGALAVLAAIPLVIYGLVKFSLIGPAIAVERIYNPLEALKRSWRLTKGNSFSLFGFYLLLAIAWLVVSTVIALLFGLVFLALGEGVQLTVLGVIDSLLGAAGSTIAVAVLAAVHRQLAIAPEPAPPSAEG